MPCFSFASAVRVRTIDRTNRRVATPTDLPASGARVYTATK